MSETIDLSICIVSYNVCGYLKICLDSIYSYTPGNLNAEVIIVDNASSDGSVQMVRDFYPQAKLKALDKNAGFAAGNNIALKEAKGDFLFLLNPDTKLGKNSLSVLIDYLKNHPECGIAGPKLLNEDGSIQNGLRKFPALDVVLFRNTPLKHLKYFRSKIDQYHMRDFDLKTSGFVDQVSGAAMMFSRKTFEKIGFLDERFYIFFEEVDYCKRASNLGLQVYYNSDAEIMHYGGKSSVQLNSKIRYIHMESQVKYLQKHMSFPGYYIFIILFKLIYLFIVIFEFLIDLIAILAFKLLSLINPEYKNSKTYINRLNKAHYRYYFVFNKFFQFIML